MGPSPAPRVSRASLKRSEGCDGCPLWLAVRGKVYDVSAWLERHPGGDILRVGAGRDATILFESYHGKHVEGLLAQFYVGDLEEDVEGSTCNDGSQFSASEENQPSNGSSEGGCPIYVGEGRSIPRKRPRKPRDLDDEVEPVGSYKQGKFYDELKDRVFSMMREKGLDRRHAPSMYIKSSLIFFSCLLTWWGTFFSPVRIVRLVSAVVFGFSRAEVGVSIQHDANHGAYSKNRILSTIAGASLDLVGASSFMWKQQHVAGHHAYTNVHGMDPDIRVGKKDIRRVTQYQPWYPHHMFQHIYLGALYSLLAIKSFAIDDFLALATGRIGPIHINKMTPLELAIFWFGKFFYFSCTYRLPWLWSTAGFKELLLLWVINEAIAGWTLAFMFQVAHVVDEVDFLKADETTGAVDREWAITQVQTTADFCHGSSFWLHVSGGLNYQVVHHLFPGVCHVHYPEIAPIVKQLCKEYKVKYQVFPSFWSALLAHFNHMKNIGSMKIPSLATVG